MDALLLWSRQLIGDVCVFAALFGISYWRLIRRVSVQSSAETLVRNLQSLCTVGSAVVSVVVNDDASVTVCVVDDWTDFADQCFIGASLENAVSIALKSRNRAMKDGG